MSQPGFQSHVEHARRITDTVLSACEPGGAMVRAWVERERTHPEIDLRKAILVAAGKASMAMARAAVEKLGCVPPLGVVVAPAGSKPPASFHKALLRVFEADHPLPSQRNLIAAQGVADAARLASSRRTPLVVLLSGGGSAHLTLPERGLTLADVRSVTDGLMKAGATIQELNTVRKKIEQLKGGKLARFAAPSPVYAFILSDVVGDALPMIASGPTADDESTAAEAMDILTRRSVSAPNVMDTLRKRLAEAKPAVLTNVTNTIIGSNTLAIDAARLCVEQLGFVVAEVKGGLDGDASERGKELAARIIGARREQGGSRGGGPVAVIWGGETTVSVRGKGFGGRNQHAALAAAIALAGEPSACLITLGTDGVDGVSPPGKPIHAGAIVTGESVAIARRAGFAAQIALETSDSYGFIAAAEAGLVTGPTGTNVNDVWVALGY
ncbi:MAG: DUF4147 domain-containing protein [Phycisphaerales bacterium]|nr:DUF4147 domain-containing protein [Phycisphaerales bacterium]